MIPSTALALLASTAALVSPAAAGSRQLKANFIKEMALATGNKKISIPKSPMDSSALRKKVMEKATPVPPERKLEQEAGNNGNQNNQGQGSDGADDYFMAYGSWSNSFGFDPTQYSLSYHRCAEVRQFDDELAAQEDSLSVFATKHFAVFRFCPAETCMGYNQEEEELSWWNRTYGQMEEEQQEQQEEEEGNKYKYAYGEEPELVGARGEGCQSNYGEYMIELGDYLEIMSEFREERFEAYCDYCEGCLKNYYQTWIKSQGGRDLKEFSDASWRDDIKDNKDFEAHFEAHRALGGCAGMDSCWKYKNICGGGISSDYEDYFECTEVERNNGQSVFVGPHCAADGYTVALGVYGDEYCNEYIGNGVNIQNVLGEKLDDNYLVEYVSGSVEVLNQMHEVYPEYGWCIPCSQQDQLWEMDVLDDDGKDVDYSSGQVSELCQNLYMASARCDMHYRSWNNKAKQSKQYAQVMNLQCDFIDSVVAGNFDELGFVKLDQENITNPTGLSGLIQKTFSLATSPNAPPSVVTPLQIFGLCASVFACCILGLWAAALHKGKSVAVTGWRPKRRNIGSAREITRQDSGIMMGRSEDGSTYQAPK